MTRETNIKNLKKQATEDGFWLIGKNGISLFFESVEKMERLAKEQVKADKVAKKAAEVEAEKKRKDDLKKKSLERQN